MKDSKKSKGRRQPLSKLPRHHPLLVKDCISDDGKESLTLFGKLERGSQLLWAVWDILEVTGNKQLCL